MAGIYIHIPFCKQACHYCDFHFSTQQHFRVDLVKALIRELEWQSEYLLNEPINTIYFGGGTPSLLLLTEIESILNAIHTRFAVNPLAEITLEANPDDLTKEKLHQLLSSGINRLSIGIQSFDDTVLKFLNRTHSAEEAILSLHLAREVGFKNISIDLIYSIPGQNQNMWLGNIKKAIRLQPEHVSCYTLTIEAKTVFGKWAKSGKLKSVDEEFSAQEFELLMSEMHQADYQHYEISNFCKPGFASKHNSSYWQQEKYLGIGPSAHSYNGQTRQFNVSNNAQYIKSINEGKVPFELEILTRENKINEYLFTSLRTSWGCNLDYVSNAWGHDIKTVNAEYLKELEARHLVIIEDTILKLTHQGKFVADKIASDLFIVV